MMILTPSRIRRLHLKRWLDQNQSGTITIGLEIVIAHGKAIPVDIETLPEHSGTMGVVRVGLTDMESMDSI